MIDFYIKRNDTEPSISSILKNSDGAPVDLAGATVKFYMRAVGGTAAKVSAAATVVDASAGSVKYQLTVGDSDTAGNYYGEFEVTFSDGKIETYPADTYLQIEVIEDLG